MSMPVGSLVDSNNNNGDDEGEWEEDTSQQQQQVVLLNQQGQPMGVIPASSLPAMQGALPGMVNSSLPPRPRPTQQHGSASGSWTSLSTLPQATQDKFREVLQSLRENGRDSMRVLIIGKGGVGKSSTVNTVLNEKVSVVGAIAGNVTHQVLPFSRSAAGFTLTLIDTPGLMESDGVNYPILEMIAKELNYGVDVVIYMDRIDDVLGEMDRMIFEALGNFFGDDFWNYVILGLSFAGAWNDPIGDRTFEDMVDERKQAMKKAIASSGQTNVDIPCILIDNSPQCPLNEENQKILATEEPWIEAMMETLVDVMVKAEEPYEYDPLLTQKSNPNKKRKWLIPLVFIAQVAIKVFLIDRVVEADSWKGDQYGPFDPDFVKEERKRVLNEKKRKQQSQKGQTFRPQSSVSRTRASEEEFDED